jgi:hypothetical protein
MFLVVSAICVGSFPLDYHPIRNVFSSEERKAQTLETIRSIRDRSDEQIVLVETGNHHTVGFSLDEVRDSVDRFIDLGRDEEINQAVNSPHKSWAELVSTRKALQMIPESDDYIIKLSGRYTLTDAFDISAFRCGDMTAKIFREHGPVRCCSVLYSMFGTRLFSEMCEQCYSRFYDRRSTSMEEMLYDWCSRKTLNEVDRLGCRGMIAVSGTQWEE